MDDLNQLWKTCFSDIPSLAHTLKHQYKGRWVRFHALSESKRCPKDQTSCSTNIDLSCLQLE